MYNYEKIQRKLVANIDTTSSKSIEEILQSVDDILIDLNANPQNKNIAIETLLNMARWYDENKKILKTHIENSYLLAFEDFYSDLNFIDNSVVSLITKNKQETIKKFKEWLSSEETFYLLEGNHKNSEAKINEQFNWLFNEATRSVKTEKTGVYTLYIVSGNASEEVNLNRTPIQLSECAQKATNRKVGLNQLEPRGYDGETNEYILFATSNKNVEKQDVFTALEEHPTKNIIFVGSSLFNPHYSAVGSMYNQKKATQHSKPFLNNLETSLTKDELSRLNTLTYLSLIGNADSTQKSVNISQFLSIVPFLPGTDTQLIENQVKLIKTMNDPEKSLQMYRFILHEIEESVKILDKLKSGFELNDDTDLIFNNTFKTILGMCRNFTSINIPECEEKNRLNKILFDVAKKSIDIYDSKDLDTKHNHNKDIYNQLKIYVRNYNIFITKLQENNTDAINVSNKTNKQNHPSENIAEKHIKDYREIFTKSGFTKEQTDHLISMIQIRHTTTKHSCFEVDSLGPNTYQFFNFLLKYSWGCDIVKFIENTDKYDTTETKKQLLNLLNTNNNNIDVDNCSAEDLVDTAWKIISKRYLLAQKTKDTLLKISQNENGLYFSSQDPLYVYAKKAGGPKKELHRKFLITLGFLDVNEIKTWSNIKSRLKNIITDHQNNIQNMIQVQETKVKKNKIH